METKRTVEWDDPIEMGREARRMSGLEFLQGLIRDDRKVPIGMTLGFRIIEAAPGQTVFEAEPGPWCFNPIGSVHGGWYAAMLDAPLGTALHTMLPQGVGYTTLELKVNLIRPIRPDTGVLRAVGKVVHLGKRTAVTEARMEDAAGNLYATATSTCLILEG